MGAMFRFVTEYPLRGNRLAVPRLACSRGLPLMGEEELLRHMRRLTPDEAAQARRHRYLPLPHAGLWRPCVITDETSRLSAQARGCCPVARADARAFSRAMQRAWAERIARRAETALAEEQPAFSAHRRLSTGQRELLVMAVLVLMLLLAFTPWALVVTLSVVFSLFYLLQAALHISAARVQPMLPRPRLLGDEELPVYTVLVPLFRETRILPQLLRALARLDYPPHKLDIKLLLEEEDSGTQEHLARLVLPDNVEVLTVPRGAPRTKPRALNYGLAFARGDLITIYDAEDVPHPGQLRLAASMFAQLPEKVACLQAPLAWYNARAGFFTRMLAVEYAAHFHVILPWLQALRLPLPLGGTSNHFRRRVLLKAGGWDPFNVTEDADLGLRLARKGYRVGVLPLLGTLEEACEDYLCWRNQRARWIKGWLQTFLVHQRTPVRMWREAGMGGYFVLYGLLGAGVFGALLHPLFVALTLATLLSQDFLADGPLRTWLLAQGLVVFAAGYAAAFFSAMQGLARTRQKWLRPWLICLPVYWLLISLAAWLALWDFIRRPHHWRKTDHGFSLLLR